MNNQNVKTAFFGSSEFSVIVLEELKSNGFLPDLIVTTPDKPKGRKMIISPNEVKVWGQANNISIISPASIRTPEFLAEISNYPLHLTASYGKIIPDSVIQAANKGSINIHPSLLPKFRGPSPLQSTILNDEKDTGVTLMLIDKEIDHGAIVAQEKITLNKWPVSFDELANITGKIGAKLFLKILPDWLNGQIKPQEQDHSTATFTKKVEKVNGEIDLNNDQYKNYLKICAYSDWPKTYFFAEKDDKKIRVIIKEADFIDNKLDIKRVIPEGKNEMSYQDFQRGLK